nr:MAG TPA: hypothetical protein [Caudoviricetes sp.]
MSTTRKGFYFFFVSMIRFSFFFCLYKIFMK